MGIIVLYINYIITITFDKFIIMNQNRHNVSFIHSNHHPPFLLPSRYSTTDSSLYGTSKLAGISHLYQGCLLDQFEFRVL